MKRILYFTLAVFIVFTSCKDEYESGFSDDPESLPAATYMEMEEAQSMSVWVELLKYADMFNTMNLSQSYTCFVPNNEAMDAYLSSKNVSSVDQLSIDEAKLLIRYHTISGRSLSSVEFNDGLVSDSTASGDNLSTQIIDGGIIRINSEANVVNTVQVTNGYIHTINRVLTPISETIWGILDSTSGYSIMREAFSKTGLDSQLDSLKINYRRIRYTLFAVPDNVYASSNITNIDDLIAKLGAGSDYTDPSNELYKYASYHLFNQQVSYSVLAEFSESDTVRSKNYNTMAEAQLMNVSEVNRVLYINYQKSEAKGISFSQTNKNTKNGVIHVVDDLITVQIPPVSKVQWELTDYSDLSLISFYRKAAGSSNQSASLLREESPCYTYVTVPESETLGWKYLLANKNDPQRIKAKNSDLLTIQLGPYGWIEMESPVIVAGKYKVILEHYNPKGSAKTGRLSIIIDGEYVGGQITTRGNSTTSDSFLKTTLGEVQFKGNTAHTLRIFAGDNAVSELDCLTFEPIN